MIRALAALVILLSILAPAAARAQFLPAPAPALQTSQPAVPAPAADPLPMAMKYYERCMDNLFPGASVDARNNFCACSADLARQRLKTEELTLLSEGKADIPYFNQADFDHKINTQVYGACIHYVARDNIKNSCLGDDNISHFFKSQEGLDTMCTCLADNATIFIQEFGADMVAVMLQRRPLEPQQDLLAAILDWPDYVREYGQWRDQCLNSYAYK